MSGAQRLSPGTFPPLDVVTPTPPESGANGAHRVPSLLCDVVAGDCSDLELLVYHCHPTLRHYGDNGIALFVLSTMFVVMYALLMVMVRYWRTFYHTKMQIRAGSSTLERWMQTLYIGLCLVHHVALVYGSLMWKVVEFPQLSVVTIAVWTAVLALCMLLLLLTVVSRNRIVTTPYVCNSLHLGFMIVYFCDRINTAAVSIDMTLQILMTLLLFYMIFKVPYVLKIRSPEGKMNLLSFAGLSVADGHRKRTGSDDEDDAAAAGGGDVVSFRGDPRFVLVSLEEDEDIVEMDEARVVEGPGGGPGRASGLMARRGDSASATAQAQRAAAGATRVQTHGKGGLLAGNTFSSDPVYSGGGGGGRGRGANGERTPLRGTDTNAGEESAGETGEGYEDGGTGGMTAKDAAEVDILASIRDGASASTPDVSSHLDAVLREVNGDADGAGAVAAPAEPRYRDRRVTIREDKSD